MDLQRLSLLRWWRANGLVLRLLPAISVPVMLLFLLLWSLSLSVREIRAERASQITADTWYVSPQGDDNSSCSTDQAPCRSVQTALDKADTDDTILVVQGVYTDDAGTVAKITKDITLQGGWNDSFAVQDPAAYPTVLDAKSLGSVIVISGPVGFYPIAPTIEGFVLTNGNGTGITGCIAPGAGGCGGGIYATNATPQILDNVITNNVATTKDEGFGGGIYLQGRSLGALIEGNTVLSNAAAISSTSVISGWGGGICLYGNPALIHDNLIQDNRASTTKGWGYGGGVVLYQSAGRVISNAVISNTASTVATGTLSGWGGGISVVQSRVDQASIIDNEIRGNLASVHGQGWGGGIQIASSTILVSGNRINDNLSATLTRGDGGGIYGRYGTWTIRDNQIISNTSTLTGTGFGGGCQLEYANVIFEDNLVAGNTATEGINPGWGGGVNLLFCNGSIIRHNIIRDNVASPSGTGWGGGLSVRFGPLTVDGNYILNNQATRNNQSNSWGGGIRIDSAAPVTITNNIIALNQARTEGGGIHLNGYTENTPAHALLIHNTLVENAQVGAGQGVYLALNASALMTNNIIASHTLGIACESSSSMATAHHTLFYGNSVADFVGLVSSSDAITGPPDFVAPADGDFHIRWSSVAVDSGSGTYVKNDIDNDPRPILDEVDLGADEFRLFDIYLPTVVINNT